MAKKETNKPDVIKANEPDPCLISLTKDGETIKAHPNQVALWMEQGWVAAEDEAPAEDAE